MNALRYASMVLLALSAVLSAPSNASAATFTVSYPANRDHTARTHTHESAIGYATRSTSGQIAFEFYNPDSGNWVFVGGAPFGYTSADFGYDCWYFQYVTGTPDLQTSWHYWRTDFGGGTTIVAPSAGHSTIACSTLAPLNP